MATFDEFIGSLEKEFGETGKGKPFEIFCKWFLENDPEWSKTVEKVWLWDEYPNKWQRQDLGTDLVFKDNEGQIWAVQAKCFAEHRTTTKGDMNSFLADTGRKEVNKRLWLQTTNSMEAKAEKTLKGQDKPVTVFMLNDFRDAQIDYPNSFSELYTAKVKEKPKPDPHQLEAIADVKAGLANQDRGQLIMACGTGKTFTTLWIKEALNAHTTLVLLPSLSLLSQTMREWAWAGNTDFEILNVCSDKSVGKKTEDMDPADAPFPVTSDIEEIANFLKQPKPKVIFCTYQSSDLIAQAQLDDAIAPFDLAIADEAHRCAGNADAGFATILDGEKIRASKRLFTTATPRYFGKAIRDEANARDFSVVGMDDEAVFGPVVHKLTFGQAIAQELLTDYQVVIVGVDEPMVREWIENYEIVSTDPDNQTDARTLAAKIGLLKAVKDYDLKRVISFHSRVAGAKQFADELVDVANLIEPVNRPEGTFLADYVSGEMKAGDRKEKIDRLKVLEGYDRGILTNARCLAEGVDVPSLDGVAFIDPRGSQVEIIQAVGRAIRKVREAVVQKKGTIVLPVFIEAGDDPETVIEASNFKPVWDVLKALRAHDEVLADTLDQYRTNMAKNASQSRERISDKIIFDMPTAVSVEFSAALTTVLVEASTASWEFWFGLLEVFYAREGHCRVPNKYTKDGRNLYNWVNRNRTSQDTLSKDRKDRLDALGFIWDPITEQWEQGYNALQKFHSTEGHCRVLITHIEDGYELGSWVSNQRTKKDNLPPNRKQKLEDLGFVWDIFDEKWEEGFMSFKQFHSREGHSKVPARHTEDGYALGSWVQTQRKNKDSLLEDRFNRLEALGFVWDPFKAAWEKGFGMLLQFKKRKRHCRVAEGHEEDGYKLGGWVATQRRAKDTMLPERFRALDDIGFVWDPSNEDWEEGIKKLTYFYNIEGHCRVPARYQDSGFGLGSWVRSLRKVKNTIPLERLKKLDAMGFIWDLNILDINQSLWDEGFDNLKKFKEREGHCCVPRSQKEDGYDLGQWVAVQRRTSNSMPSERLKRLEALGFVWSQIDYAWDQGFDHLKLFQTREGHCRVPNKHFEGSYSLGAWVSFQRQRADFLSSDQRDRLQRLEFVWSQRDAIWEDGFNNLKKFHQEHGHCRVPNKHKEGKFHLGAWVSNQKQSKEKMAQSRVDRLSALGFVWVAQKDEN
jgi:superfamily II DNA or RNA helicase